MKNSDENILKDLEIILETLTSLKDENGRRIYTHQLIAQLAGHEYRMLVEVRRGNSKKNAPVLLNAIQQKFREQLNNTEGIEKPIEKIVSDSEKLDIILTEIEKIKNMLKIEY